MKKDSINASLWLDLRDIYSLTCIEGYIQEELN